MAGCQRRWGSSTLGRRRSAGSRDQPAPSGCRAISPGPDHQGVLRGSQRPASLRVDRQATWGRPGRGSRHPIRILAGKSRLEPASRISEREQRKTGQAADGDPGEKREEAIVGCWRLVSREFPQRFIRDAVGFLGVNRARIGNGRSWQDSSRRSSTPRPCAAPRDGSRRLCLEPTGVPRHPALGVGMRDRIRLELRRLVLATQALRRAYPAKRFTLDGRLVGTLGKYSRSRTMTSSSSLACSVITMQGDATASTSDKDDDEERVDFSG